MRMMMMIIEKKYRCIQHETSNMNSTEATKIPTTVDQKLAGDDATTLTTKTTLTQDQVNEINFIQANIGNIGTTVA